MSYLVLDIETVVDPSVWSPPADQPDAFPPPFAWRPLCIGAVLLERDAKAGFITTKRVGVMEELELADADPAGIERSILSQFGTWVRKEMPTLITWNGRRFDLPVLILRSMRFGFQQAWYFNSRDTRYRYTEDGHCDLADAMTDYGSAPACKLDGMAKLIGLPGKFGDIDGAKVGEAFAAGRLRDIGTYCMSDAVQTAFLWLRWLLLKGQINESTYRKSAEGLLKACEDNHRMTSFVGLVDRHTLLLEGSDDT